MFDIAQKVLEKIENHGFSAYLVGGFVRDYIMGIDSNDIDITTNAKPKELLEIFEDALLPNDDYGSVCVYVKNVRFEITTFRREVKYDSNRKPIEIEYIDDLHEDLMRRDFTINSICMNKNGEIIDLLNGINDINNKIIRVIGDCNKKFTDDPLRILRCIRFASKLEFDIDSDINCAIINNKHLLKNISYEKKMEELNKMFTSTKCMDAINLLLKYNLDNDLELYNLKNVTYTDSLIGIWAVLDVCEIYKFSSNEKDQIDLIKNALRVNNIDPYNLYKYGLYANSIAGSIKGLDNKKINEAYSSLAIHGRSELNIEASDIISIFNKEPGVYIKKVFEDIERAVLYRNIENERSVLLDYCKSMEVIGSYE